MMCNGLLMSEEGLFLFHFNLEKTLWCPLGYIFLKNMLCCCVQHGYIRYRTLWRFFRLYSLHATEIYIIILFFHMLQLVVFYFRSNFEALLPLHFSAYCFLAKIRHFIPNYYDFNWCCNWPHIAICLVVYMYEYHLSIFLSHSQMVFLSWQCLIPWRRGTQLRLLFVCMFLLFLLALIMCILSRYLLYPALLRPLPHFPGLAFH